MAETSSIEWTDATFNPWIGCTRVSPGCDNCYAAMQDKFRKWTPEGWGGPRRRTSPANWRKPLQWNAERFVECAQCGHRCELREFKAGPADFTMCPRCSCHDYCDARRRVFCASLADVFDNEVPAEWRWDLFDLIHDTPNLDWLLLTKRIGNAANMLPVWFEDPAAWEHGGGVAHHNVWIGATVVNQEEADRDIPKLLGTPARVRFLSMEPLLGPVTIDHRLIAPIEGTSQHGQRFIDWIIVGGESGPWARPFDVAWARSIVTQCRGAGLPVHVKQLGAFTTWDGHGWPGEQWPPDIDHRDTGNGNFRMRLRDPKGGDWLEWPADLRVRSFPNT